MKPLPLRWVRLQGDLVAISGQHQVARIIRQEGRNGYDWSYHVEGMYLFRHGFDFKLADAKRRVIESHTQAHDKIQVRFIPIGMPGETMREKFAEALATELAIEGIISMGALPVAISIMRFFQAAIDYGSLQAGIDEMKKARRQSDQWWVKQHPRTKHAAAARVRLKMGEDHE